MQRKRLSEAGGLRTYAVVLQTGEEVMDCLRRFVKDERISAAQITAIGALSDAVLQYFEWDKKAYRQIPIGEQVEVASMIGDVAEGPTGEPSLHIHVVLGKHDGRAMAGHLAVAYVQSPAHLRKKKDPATGLALLRLEK